MNGATLFGFAELFDGNQSVTGAWEGGCLREQPNYAGHLTGTCDPIGIYPMVMTPGGRWVVRWGCIDIDEDDLPQAVNVETACTTLGLTGWIEISRSKGYHVWVFADDWVPAIDMRRALLAVHQISGSTSKEVNPKQVELPVGKVGNYVRLPYGRLRPDEKRMVVLSQFREAMPLEDFVEHALLYRVTHADLLSAGELYQEPPPRQSVNFGGSSGPAAEVARRLNGLGWTLYSKGPQEGHDRSTTLVALAFACDESGLTPDEAVAIVTDADERWGKYSGRADAEQRIEEIVRRAYE